MNVGQHGKQVDTGIKVSRNVFLMFVHKISKTGTSNVLPSSVVHNESNYDIIIIMTI